MIGAKEIYQQERERELSQKEELPTLAELDFNRNAYCSGCNTNWKNLPTAEGEDDEVYEFCPLCNTDEHLQEGKDSPALSFSPFNPIERVTTKSEPPPVKENRHPFDLEKHYRKQEKKEAIDNEAIAAYQKAFALGGQEAGEKAYREVLNKHK